MTSFSPSPPITWTAFDCGIFRIFKHPGDENCKDDNYAITVDFTLNDPGIYNDPNVAYATHGADYVLKVGNTPWSVTLVNGVYKGSVTIPAGQSYVDITIEALNDNISDNNERVYLNITDAYVSYYPSSYGYPFKFSNVPAEDYITIKDEGWWIKSVEWVKNPYGNALFTEWTGLSVYADSDVPEPFLDDYRKVDVVVTVGGLLPTLQEGGGQADLLCFYDPQSASRAGEQNNGGTGIFPGDSSSYEMFFYRDHDDNADGDNNKMTQRVTATLKRFAGDNYIIMAIPYNDEPDSEVISETLTVWRRLWVECDAMPYYPPSNPCDVTIPPSPEDYLGLATSELERACVRLEIYEDNLNQPMAGQNPMTTVDYFRCIGSKTTPGSGRDIYGNDPDSFWTVRIVMASQFDLYQLNNYLPPNIPKFNPNTFAGGVFAPEGINTILIYYETINGWVSDWNKHSTEIATTDEVIPAIVLHEICHVLIDDYERHLWEYNGAFYNRIFTSGSNIPIDIPVDTSDVGVRDTISFWFPNGHSEPDIKNIKKYNKLLVKDIRDIQSHSTARDN